MALSQVERGFGRSWFRHETWVSTRLGPIAGPALIMFVAAVAVSPQCLRGISCGHDFDFHLVSWFDAQSAWRLGIPYPHWTPSANFNAGEPRFVFYPR